jgi:LysM repeat protein
MRKTAVLLVLVAFVATSYSLVAQSVMYIRFDSKCMDKLDHRFLGNSSRTIYTSYRINKNDAEKIFLDAGVESPEIRKAAPKGLVSCADIDANDISAINAGLKKAVIVKKLDSGWALQAIGSGSYMSFFDNILNYNSPNYDFQADFRAQLGNNLGTNPKNLDNPSQVFYVGELPACNKTGYNFKVTPGQMCKVETAVSVLPELGLIREHADGCPVYELVAINGKDVCAYLEPRPVASEPTPESYSTVAVRTEEVAMPTETGEVYVRAKDVETPIRSESFEEQDAAPTAYNVPVVKTRVDCTVKASEGEHIIQQGESLYSIARRYGLTVNMLRSWNGLESDMIYPCTPLKVAAPPVEVTAAPSVPKAKSNKPSMDVARANDIPASYNRVVKVVPKKIEKPAAKPVEQAETKVETIAVECEVEYTEGEHVVLQGENLYGIAKKYDATMEELMAWNGLKSNVIHPCQKLTVSAPAKSEVEVSPKSVPQSYQIVVKPKSAPKNYARVLPKKQKRTIAPVVSSKSVAVKKEAKSAGYSGVYVKKGSGLHVVAKGETVSGLANRFEMSEADFRKVNFLGKTEAIYVGQVLRTQNCACTIEANDDNELTLKEMPLPVPISNDVPIGYNVVTKKSVNTEGGAPAGTSRKYHVVQPLETLFTIAKKYDRPVEELRRLNRLDENEVIIPNQLLILE